MGRRPGRHPRSVPCVASHTLSAEPVTTLREIFEAHADFVWRVLARSGVRDADLPDATQDVFVVVNDKLHQRDPAVKTTTWLYGIAIRVGANQRRKVQRKREDFADESLDVIPASAKNPEAVAEAAQAREELARVLDSLKPEQRLVFELFELEEHTCPAIAESLGLPLGTVYTRLRAARAAFAEAAEALR